MINLKSLTDAAWVADVRSKATAVRQRVNEHCREILAEVERKIASA